METDLCLALMDERRSYADRIVLPYTNSDGTLFAILREVIQYESKNAERAVAQSADFAACINCLNVRTIHSANPFVVGQ